MSNHKYRLRKVSGYEVKEDLKLIAQARNGDMASFSELVRKYEPLVASTVKGMLGNNDDAEDTGQMVFIRFYKALDAFRGEASLSTYLTKIAINLSLNELKRRKQKRKLNIFRRDDEKEQQFEIADPDDAASAYDTKEAVNKALLQLEPKFRSVVVLRMLQGYSTIETANILKLPTGTVLSRLSRAQEKLKELLKPLIE